MRQVRIDSDSILVLFVAFAILSDGVIVALCGEIVAFAIRSDKNPTAKMNTDSGNGNPRQRCSTLLCRRPMPKRSRAKGRPLSTKLMATAQ